MATQFDLSPLALRSVAARETLMTVADRLPDDISDTVAEQDMHH
jgi:hypothetical protein